MLPHLPIAAHTMLARMPTNNFYSRPRRVVGTSTARRWIAQLRRAGRLPENVVSNTPHDQTAQSNHINPKCVLRVNR
jgi:hypothetical protein